MALPGSPGGMVAVPIHQTLGNLSLTQERKKTKRKGDGTSTVYPFFSAMGPSSI